jgi:hypothetical protein
MAQFVTYVLLRMIQYGMFFLAVGAFVSQLFA